MNDIVEHVLDRMQCMEMSESVYIPAIDVNVRYDRGVFHVQNTSSAWTFHSPAAVSYVCLSCLDNLFFAASGQFVTVYLQHAAVDGCYSLPVLNVTRYTQGGPWLLSNGETFVFRFDRILRDFADKEMKFEPSRLRVQ